MLRQAFRANFPFQNEVEYRTFGTNDYRAMVTMEASKVNYSVPNDTKSNCYGYQAPCHEKWEEILKKSAILSEFSLNFFKSRENVKGISDFSVLKNCLF